MSYWESFESSNQVLDFNDSVQKSSVASKNEDFSTMNTENEKARDKWNYSKACLQVYTNKENLHRNEQRKTEISS